MLRELSAGLPGGIVLGLDEGISCLLFCLDSSLVVCVIPESFNLLDWPVVEVVELREVGHHLPSEVSDHSQAGVPLDVEAEEILHVFEEWNKVLVI